MSLKSIKLSIDEPCKAGWQDMEQREKGRFCAQCHKTVIDFTLFSDKELNEWFLNSDKNTCGRLNVNQLNRYMLPSGPVKRNVFAYRLMLGTILGFGFINKSGAVTDGNKARTEVFSEPKETLTLKSSPARARIREITVFVSDSISGKPLADVIVQIENKKSKTYVYRTDSSGKLAIKIRTQRQEDLVLRISGAGDSSGMVYESYSIAVSAIMSDELRIELKPSGMQIISDMVGGIRPIHRSKAGWLWWKTKRFFRNIF